MFERVDKLEDFLYGNYSTLEFACSELGFSADDLSAEELDDLNSRIFRCDKCGYWFGVDEKECIIDEDFCWSCFCEIEDEEE